MSIWIQILTWYVLCPGTTWIFKTRFKLFHRFDLVLEIRIHLSFYQLFLFEVRIYYRNFNVPCTSIKYLVFFKLTLKKKSYAQFTLHKLKYKKHIIHWKFINNFEVSPLWTYSNYTLSHTQNGGVCSRRNKWAFLCRRSSWCALWHTAGRPVWSGFCVEVTKPPHLLITTPPVMWTSIEDDDWKC